MADKKTQVAKETATDSKYVSRKRRLYHEEVVPYLMQHFGYKNVNECAAFVSLSCLFALGLYVNAVNFYSVFRRKRN